MKLTRCLRGALAAVTTLTLAACHHHAEPNASDLRGVVQTPGTPRPDFTLTEVNGQPYHFRAQTAGRLTFLYFGYTNCPDACPVQLANLATALHHLSYEDRQKVTVVFVTTDPQRDSASRLKAWLASFDPAFIGLLGPLDQINRVEASIGMPPTFIGKPDTKGNYEVGHAAEMLAFSPDDSAHVGYPFGFRQEDWVHDLPLLLTRYSGRHS